MNYPRVKFRVSPAQDKENYRWFVRFAPPQFVEMFLPPDLAAELKGVESARNRQRVVGQYVDVSFRKDAAAIRRNAASLDKSWRAKEKDYFSLVESLFPGCAWPNGKYVGYASVFRMYPRDVHDRTFFFRRTTPSTRWRPRPTSYCTSCFSIT